MILNLDGMNETELWELWEQCYHNPRRTALLWFPERPEGYVRTATDLSHYACNKSVAMKYRAKGEISVAELYEKICENIYDKLPAFARW